MTVTDTPPSLDYQLTGWDLSELLPEPSDGVIAERLAELETAVARFEARRPELHGDMDSGKLLALLRDYEALHELLDRLAGYGSLWFAEDTQSRAAQSFKNRVEQAVTGYYNRILFFELWWKSLPDAEAANLLPPPADDDHPDAHPHTADHRHFLLDLRRSAPFKISFQ
jgi:oligoendopeptidase F